MEPEGLSAGWPEGRPEFPYDGLDAGVPADGLFTAFPEGRDELLPTEGREDCPDGRELWPEGLTEDCPDGRDAEPDETAGDLWLELFDDDLCTDSEREEPEEVRDAPFLDCAERLISFSLIP